MRFVTFGQQYQQTFEIPSEKDNSQMYVTLSCKSRYAKASCKEHEETLGTLNQVKLIEKHIRSV